MVLDSGVTVGALVAVNALGSATVGDTPHFWAAPFETGDEFGGRGVARTYPAPHIAVTKIATHARLSAPKVTRSTHRVPRRAWRKRPHCSRLPW